MRRTMGVITLAAWLVATTVATADPKTAALGMSIAAARDLYPEARQIPTRRAGAVTLELSDVAFADMRWRTVDFIFNAQGRLDRVQLVTRTETFDHLRARLHTDADAFFGTATQASLVSNPDMLEMKICDLGESGVFLTYEKISDPV